MPLFLCYLNRKENTWEVDVYDSTHDVAQRVEWMDILEPDLIMVDEHGVCYRWDRNKTGEEGMTYGYTLVESGINKELAEACLKFQQTSSDPFAFKFPR